MLIQVKGGLLSGGGGGGAGGRGGLELIIKCVFLFTGRWALFN